MNKEIKEKWVAWLRANPHKQGKGALRPTDDTFCCLGGLCEIVGPDMWEIGNGKSSKWRNGGAMGTLPDYVVEISDLNDNNPVVSRGMLSKLNDRGMTFAEIADIIEKEL